MPTTGASTKRPPMSEMMKGVTVTMASSYISIPQVKTEDTVRQLFYFTLDFFCASRGNQCPSRKIRLLFHRWPFVNIHGHQQFWVDMAASSEEVLRRLHG